MKKKSKIFLKSQFDRDLERKIRINMNERRARGWTKKQALAVSYSQVRRGIY